MSNLVLNERTIDRTLVITKNITVKRCAHTNNGVRIWFQILTTDNEMFQRWAMNMNPTDEIMLLLEKDDKLEIEYIEDKVEDLVSLTFTPFNRNVILNAKFIE